MNHEVDHFSGGSNYPMWLKWADFPLSIVCLLLLPFCDLGESRQWHMLPVCGFGPYQLAEADLDRSQNKQSVGGNSYTSDSTLFQGQCLTHTQHAEQLQLHLAFFFFLSEVLATWSRRWHSLRFSFWEKVKRTETSSFAAMSQTARANESLGMMLMSYTDSLFQ